jgi:STE24 endopeptidase
MNPYALIVVTALLADWGLNLAADLFNLRALSPKLPEEFHGVYDAETYRRSQDYTRVRTRFGLLPRTVNLLLLLLFWFLDGFDLLDRWLSSFGRGTISTGLAFIGILALGHALLTLPFRLYSTFVIEARFGFNRTTHATFWVDLAKGLVLSVALGAPVLTVILFLFERAGPLAWVYCWIATTALVLLIQFITPAWILPLFNTFTPVEAGELRDAILSYARSVAFPLKGIFVIDGSKRSTRSNAFFTGFGKHKRIALFDTLIDSQTTPELVAVVAHEIGHYKKRHILKRLVFSIVHMGVVLALLSFFLTHDGLFAAFGMQRRPIYAGLVFFSLLYTPIELVLSFVLHASSRRDEYAADRFAAQTTGQPEMLASALKHLSVHNLSNLTPHPFYVALNHSHPSVLNRITALRSLSREDSPIGSRA